MREGLVSFGHAVGVVLFLTGSTFTFDDSADEEVPRPPPQAGSTPSWFNMFGFGQTADGQRNQFADQQFESAFEEMMHDEDLADKDSIHTASPVNDEHNVRGYIAESDETH